MRINLVLPAALVMVTNAGPVLASSFTDRGRVRTQIPQVQGECPESVAERSGGLQARIAAISGPTPNIWIIRFML